MQHFAPEVFVPVQPSRLLMLRGLPKRPKPAHTARHARLFELIRQENLQKISEPAFDQVVRVAPAPSLAPATAPEQEAESMDTLLAEALHSLGAAPKAA